MIITCKYCGKQFKDSHKTRVTCSFLCRNRLRRNHLQHGMTGTHFYNKFLGLKRRCEKLNNPKYYRYGGRGIKCLWKSFEEFKKDMYPSYLRHVKKYGNKETTLDRKNNDGNYCKENCRWATRKEQANNRGQRRKHGRKLQLYQGKLQSFEEVTNKLNVKVETLRTYTRKNSFKKAVKYYTKLYDHQRTIKAS